MLRKILHRDYLHGWPQWNKASLSLPAMSKTISNVIFIKIAEKNSTKKGSDFQMNFNYFLTGVTYKLFYRRSLKSQCWFPSQAGSVFYRQAFSLFTTNRRASHFMGLVKIVLLRMWEWENWERILERILSGVSMMLANTKHWTHIYWMGELHVISKDKSIKH